MTLTVSVSDIVEESSEPLLAKHPEWERVRLDNVATILNGYAFASEHFTKEVGVPLLRIRDVGESATECRYRGEYDDLYLVKLGDLVVGMDGDFKCAKWSGPAALLNQRVCKVAIDTTGYVPRFLELALPGYLDAIADRTSSQTVKHLSSSSLAELPLPLPPLGEQQRIVAQLDKLLSHVNCARVHLSRVPPILGRFRQAVLASACSGRLTEDWRDNRISCEPTSLLMESVLGERKAGARTKYRPPSEMDSDDLPDIPESWRWVAFDNLVTDSFYGPRFSADDYAPEGVPTIRTSDIGYDGSIQLNSPPRLQLSEELLRDLCLRHEDLLVTRTGATIGKCALYDASIGPAIPSAYLIRFRLTRKTIPPKYVLLFLMSPLGQQRLLGGSTAVAQPNVNAKNIGKFPVPLPPRTEITEIVRRAELLLALADTLEQRVVAATSRANKLTQSILSKAFRGELVPTEAELARREGRDYEPASVLLERIRSTRDAGKEKLVKPKRKRRKLSAHV